MIFTRDDLRPVPSYPTYPPYHSGLYLEDYFYKKFIENNPHINRDYIAISWTTLYCENNDKHIQSFLDNLDPTKKYFTVLQHDDAPRHRLPPDTICFSAGGNVFQNNTVPIPLICSPITGVDISKKELKYTASFVGSATHQIRIQMARALLNKEDYQIWVKQWSPSIDKSEFDLFIDLALQSKYLLCPRGYGLNSFRLYESFQLKCVPVIVTDKPYLPWSDELNWSEFAVIIDEKNVLNIDKILKQVTENQYNNMLQRGQELYNNYFTLDGIYDNIVKRLK